MADWTDESCARMHQGAAYVMAQTICALAEIEGMKAENAGRADKGMAQAYGHESFVGVIDKYGIHHNGVMTMFEQYR